jgi:hypothetical protein
VNQRFHAECLSENMCQKQPELRHPGDWFLHHNTAPVHRAMNVQSCVASNGMTVVPRPLYPADLTHCDFFFSQYSGFKLAVNIRRCYNVSTIQEHWQATLAQF